MRAQTAYADLLEMHREMSYAEVSGAVIAKNIRDRMYLYEVMRLGKERYDRYLGPDTPELRKGIERSEELRRRGKERRARMTKLVQALRIEGIRPIDSTNGSLLAAFARGGLFRLGGTLIGTWAYTLYEAELGVLFGEGATMMTQDIDFASFQKLSVALGDHVTEEPSGILKAMKFDPVPNPFDRQVWRWRQSGTEAMVEFLTPAFGDESIKPLPALGVSAQGLNYLNYLIRDPIPAVAPYRSGVLVQIPAPERYAIHKLIVSERRMDAGHESAVKRNKDRHQAATLIDILSEDRPDELALAYDEARSEGPRWRERLDAALSKMPDSKERIDRVTEDPYEEPDAGADVPDATQSKNGAEPE